MEMAMEIGKLPAIRHTMPGRDGTGRLWPGLL